MQHKARYAICGMVEGVDRKDTKSPNGAPPVEIRLTVYTQGKGAHYYKVSVYDAKYIDTALALREGQEIYVSGRLTGGISEKGYYNYYLTAEHILLDALPPGKNTSDTPAPARNMSYTPPRNYKEAAAQEARMSNTDIPF